MTTESAFATMHTAAAEDLSLAAELDQAMAAVVAELTTTFHTGTTKGLDWRKQQLRQVLPLHRHRHRSPLTFHPRPHPHQVRALLHHDLSGREHRQPRAARATALGRLAEPQHALRPAAAILQPPPLDPNVRGMRPTPALAPHPHPRPHPNLNPDP